MITTVVQTQSGSVYEVDGLTVRRRPAYAPDAAAMRRDNEWVELMELPELPVLGQPWTLKLKSLVAGVPFTIRTTSPVIRWMHALTGGEKTGKLPMDEFEEKFRDV